MSIEKRKSVSEELSSIEAIRRRFDEATEETAYANPATMRGDIERLLDEIDRLTAAKSGVGITDEMVGWQLIETAPKDGTRIDCWVHHPDGDFRSVNCRWAKMSSPLGDPMDGFVSKDGAPLCAMKPYGSDKWLTYPTHWMPLPPPPTSDGGRE